MFSWFKKITGWEKKIKGKVLSIQRKIARSSKNSSRKTFYNLKIETKNEKKDALCWKSNLWLREWKLVKALKKNDEIEILARKKWFSKHIIIKKIISPENFLAMLKREDWKKEEKEDLKLSYTDPNLWWKRDLDINSKEWKSIRQKILIRDDYSCYFCKIRASKYMIIDHISGNAQDNKVENLRVLCAMCDTIRHSGLAGIQGTLKVRASKLSQIEIVRRTREFFLKERKIPKMKDIDPDSIEINQLPIKFAVLESEERPKEWKKYKGFFTKNFFEKKFTARFLEYIIL